MGNTSIVVKQKDISKRIAVKDYKIIVTPNLPVNNKKYEFLRLKIHRHMMDTVKSSLLVFSCLALYKFAGIHAWWIQFVDKILAVP